MPGRRTPIRMILGGGFATSFGPTAEVGLGPGGLVVLPFLNSAENVTFTLDGGTSKIGGAEKINTSAYESGQQIRGIFDYWRWGGSLTPTQKRVIHVGTTIKKDDADGTFTNIQPSAQEDDKVPSYAVYEDLLVIATDSTVDVPLKWDQSGNAATLGTNTPLFSFGVTHHNRFFAAGVSGNESRLYYSQDIGDNGPDGDWDGTGAGFIDIDPGDGDRILGLASHKNELWIFKGPHKQSIHRLIGSAPTGGDAFARVTFVEGISSVNHNAIFRFRDDLGFVAPDGTVHSLKAVAAFGDFIEASLSRDINNGWIDQHVNLNALKWTSTVTLDRQGIVVFSFPIDGDNDPSTLVAMDYRFENPRWAIWPAYDGNNSGALGRVIDTNGVPRCWVGGNDGFLRRTGVANRNIDTTTAIQAKTKTPFLSFGAPQNMKTLYWGAASIQPKGNYNLTFGWTRDNNPQDTQTVSQAGGDVLGGLDASGGISNIRDWSGFFGGAFLNIATVQTGTNLGLSVGDTIVIYGTANYDGRHVLTGAIFSAPNYYYQLAAASYIADESGVGTAQAPASPATFVLGISQLGGASFLDRFLTLNEGGEFRSIEFEVSNGGLNEDLELHGLACEIDLGSLSLEN